MMAELAAGSVVQVIVNGNRVAGAGWIYRVDRQGRAWILTNEHVVRGSRTATVRRIGSGATRVGTVAGVDAIRDLAVLTACCDTGWNPLPIAATNTLHAGAHVVALGLNSNGVRPEPRISSGVVSSFGFHDENRSWIVQSDAATDPGGSGGPLLNTEGQVVGVISSRVDPAMGEDFGFAIAMRTVNEELGFLELGAGPVDRNLAVPDGPAKTGEVTVTITGGIFNPPLIKVKVGTTVTWENQSGSASNATSMEGEAEQWDTDAIWNSAFDRDVCCGRHTFSVVGCHRYESSFSNDSGIGIVCVVE